MKMLTKLFPFLRHEPRSQSDLMTLLHDAKQRGVVNAELVVMIEGVLQIAKMQASEVMVPKPNMTCIKDDSAYEDIVNEVNDSAHSRYPVVNRNNHDEVMGIMLAKDLLLYQTADQQQDFDLKKIIREAVMVPETKRLDALLSEFRLMHNHMAIVVDEYGSITGLVTIEDVLEEIVGEIEDEHDVEEEEFDIQALDNHAFAIDAQCPLDVFNDHFKTTLKSHQFNTLGGVIMHAFGYLPAVDEEIAVHGLGFKVAKADSRRIHQVIYTHKNSEMTDEKSS